MSSQSSMTKIPGALSTFDHGGGLSPRYECNLLDTNVISETGKIRANPAVTSFLGAADPAGLFLSVLSLGELRKGVAARHRSDPVVADQLGAWVDGIETIFADRVLPVDAAVARLWGELSAGRSVPVIDTLANRRHRDRDRPRSGDPNHPRRRGDRRPVRQSVEGRVR
jgi:predicted nucleic acid-binding protein